MTDCQGENARGDWMAMRVKLQQLEERQFELVRDNFELKQLCLILDAERDNEIDLAQIAINRNAQTNSTPQILTQQVLKYIKGKLIYDHFYKLSSIIYHLLFITYYSSPIIHHHILLHIRIGISSQRI